MLRINKNTKIQKEDISISVEDLKNGKFSIKFNGNNISDIINEINEFKWDLNVDHKTNESLIKYNYDDASFTGELIGELIK